VASVRRGSLTLDAAVAELVGRLTGAELLWLLDGDLTVRRGVREMSQRYNKVPFEAGRIDRLGIPGIRFTDGPPRRRAGRLDRVPGSHRPRRDVGSRPRASRR
jgi:beta-glucosidase